MDFELLGILLGFLQGLFEWLPVSSEGQLVIFIVQLFGTTLEDATSLALFAHIGTALVVLVYYRSDFLQMFSSSKNFILSYIQKKNTQDFTNELLLTRNLIIVTVFTLPTALLSLLLLEDVVNELSKSLPISLSSIIILIVGIFLLITGLILNLRKKSSNNVSKNTGKLEDLKFFELALLGLFQGLAAVPGLSRSGITITYLLLGTRTKLNQEQAIRASFIVSVPVSLGAGFLQVIRGKISFNSIGLISEGNVQIINYLGILLLIITAFIVGWITLKTFLDVAKNVEFDKFMIIFGFIAIIAIIFGLFLT
jgi:undecaprenyl-diphosphatase